MGQPAGAMGQPAAQITHMSNNPRIYLWIALALVVFLNYQAWMTDYGPKPGANTAASAQTSTAPSNTAASTTDLSNKIPQASPTQQPGTASNKPTPPAASTTATQTAASAAVADAAAAQVVHVHTDVLDVDISTLGGTIQKADLLQYTQVKGEAALVRLENVDDPLTTFVLQSGLVGPEKTSYPTHLAKWSTEKTS